MNHEQDGQFNGKETEDEEIDRLYRERKDLAVHGGQAYPVYGEIVKEVSERRRPKEKAVSEQVRQLWQAPSGIKEHQALVNLDVETATNLRGDYYQLIETSIAWHTTEHPLRYEPSELEISDTINRLTTLSLRITNAHPEQGHRHLHADYQLGFRVLTAQGMLESGLVQHYSRGMVTHEKGMIKQAKKDNRQPPRQ